MPARQLSFGHDALAQRVVGELVASLKPGAGSSTEPALVVGVFGEWGAGKSRLLQTIADALPRGESEGKGEQALTVVVPFNAWRFEREEQLLVPLLRVAQQCLRKALEDSLAPDIPRNEKLSDRLVLLGDLAQTVYQHGGRELLQTALAAQGVALKLPELKPLKPEAGEPQPSMWARWRRRREALAQARRLAMPADSLHSLYYDFLEHLKAVTGRNPAALALHRERLKYRGLGWWPRLRWRMRAGLGWVGTGELPAEADFRLNLVFLVDDLDRCLPDKAVEVLEAIKLFLEVEGCAFVLALDEEVVERGIAHRYRDYALQGREGLTPITGAEYLEKLVHLPVRLPRPTRAEAEDFLAGRHAELFGTPGAPNALARLVAAITPAVPRKLCRMVDLLDMADQLAMPLGGSGPERREWLAVACALQLFAPSLYRFLRLRGATLLLTLADWRADARLRDLEALREQLAREVREVASPAQLNYRLVLLRLPDLCATALQNRSGFDLLELLAQVGELRQRAPLSSTQLGALLAFTEARPEEDAVEAVAPAVAVPDPVPRVEPAMPTAMPIAEPAAPAANLVEPAPSPAATDVRLEDERGLLEALVSGDVELVRFALSREGGALQGNSLPAAFWDRLWGSPWLARIEAWVDEGMPPGAVEQNLRELRPHLSQAMAMQMLQRFGSAMHSVLRRPSWARQVDANPADKGPLRLMSPPIGEGTGVWLATRDAEGAAGWRIPRGWRCATWTAWTNAEGDFLTELKLGADETFGVYALLTLRRQGSPRPATQRLRWVEPGGYMLGSPPSEPGRGPDERTPGLVRVEGFWMADTACTLSLWWTLMADKPDAVWDGERDDEPVMGLSPADAAEFLRRLGTLLPVCAVRLPSEVEWECACRAGTTTPWSFGAELTPGLAHTSITGPGPCPVASLPPNPWGLYEMHGNVAEICCDWTPAGGAASPDSDLVALRGGSFADPPAATRSAASRTLRRGERCYDAGFRFTLRDGSKDTATPA